MSQGKPRPAQSRKGGKPKVQTEKPRFLHRNPGASGPRWIKDKDNKWVRDPNDDGQRDYTDRRDHAMAGEPEPIDDETLARYTKDAQDNFAIVHAEEIQRRKVRSLLGRLRTVAIAQTKAGSDPTPALEQAVADLEREQAS